MKTKLTIGAQTSDMMICRSSLWSTSHHVQGLSLNHLRILAFDVFQVDFYVILSWLISSFVHWSDNYHIAFFFHSLVLLLLLLFALWSCVCVHLNCLLLYLFCLCQNSAKCSLLSVIKTDNRGLCDGCMLYHVHRLLKMWIEDCWRPQTSCMSWKLWRSRRRYWRSVLFLV